MKYDCCVSGCRSKSNKLNPKSGQTKFFDIPSEYKNGVIDPLRTARRYEWLKWLGCLCYEDQVRDNFKVCSKHFVKGCPADPDSPFDADWIPSVSPRLAQLRIKRSIALNKSKRVVRHNEEVINNIIKNIPEVNTQFDTPDYIRLDRLKFNERKIEIDLFNRLEPPICDDNGSYVNDHDYLGLPLVLPKNNSIKYTHKEHNYSLFNQPACSTFDSRHFCNICRQNLMDLFSFNKHLMAHTTANDVMCPICFRNCMTSTCLNIHISIHTSLCDKCGRRVPNAQIQAHEFVNAAQKATNDEISKYSVSPKNKVYFCIKCMRMFRSKKNYNVHVSLHKKMKR